MAADAEDLKELAARFSAEELAEMRRKAPDMPPAEFLRHAALMMMDTMEEPPRQDEEPDEEDDAAEPAVPSIVADPAVEALLARVSSLESLVAEVVDVSWTILSELYAHTSFPADEQGCAMERACRSRAEEKINRIRAAVLARRGRTTH